MKRWLLVTAVGVALSGAALARAGHQDGKILILAQPFARADALWMAVARGFFKDEQLAVTVKWVSSGADALRTFENGRDGTPGSGDFVVVNEVLAMNFWQGAADGFTVVAPLARDAAGYVAVAKKEVANASALRTKAVGTQLGSTTAWFVSEYLRAHGLSERDVALKHDPLGGDIAGWNPEQSDIAAFFVREPLATVAIQTHGDRVHRLSTAQGYIHGYLLLGTWKRYLREHPGVAERVLRALDRGRRHAEEHKADVIRFASEMFGKETDAVAADYGTAERLLAIDRATLDDFRNLGRWMKDAGLLPAAVDPIALFDPEPLRRSLPDRVPAEVR
jgi:ABC-type nitrate/sulfonate/bicarbonate transport system substrate-binding protein